MNVSDIKLNTWYINSYNELFLINKKQVDPKHFYYRYRIDNYDKLSVNGSAINPIWSEDSKIASKDIILKRVPKELQNLSPNQLIEIY